MYRHWLFVGNDVVMGARVSVSLLGPLEIRNDGIEVHVTQQRACQLLALLARRPGSAMSFDEITEELWGAAGLPANPHQAIRTAMSRLRSALGEANVVVQTRPDGYALVDADVDTSAFVDRADGILAQNEATPDQIESITHVLGLWRGDPLAGISRTLLLDEWAESLLGMRCAIEHRLGRLLTSVGRTDEAVRLLIPLRDRVPTDESITITLATALVNSGAKADALSSLGRLRGDLRESLGVEPSHELCQLEQDILHGRIGLDLHHGRIPETARRDPSDAMVGRVAQLRELREGGSPLTVVSGHSGAGKSELLRALIASVSHGDEIGFAECEAHVRADQPLQTIRSLVLRLASLGSMQADSRIAQWAESLADPALLSVESRSELVDTLASAVGAACRENGLSVLVDDAQWLDRTSAEVLREIARNQAVEIVLFARLDQEATDFWDSSSLPIRHLAVPPFDQKEVRAFLQGRYPHLDRAALVTSLLGRSGGNPLFLSLLAEGLTEGTLSSGNLPVNLLMAAGERLNGLSPAVQRDLQIAAAIGPQFSIELLASISGRQPDLREAATAGLITLDPDLGTFSHGLIAEATLQLLAPVRRVDLHDSIGTHLESRGAPPSAYAHHYVSAAPLDPDRAVRALIDAGDEFYSAFDLDGALARYEHALECLHPTSPVADRLRACAELKVGMMQRRLGHQESADTLCRSAELARDSGENAVFFSAVVELCQHGGTSRVGSVDERAIGLLNSALSHQPSDFERLRLCSAAATVLSFSTHGAEARSLFRTAWAGAAESGDDLVEAEVLTNAHLGLSHPDDLVERERATRRLRELAFDNDQRWECAFLDAQHAVIRADRSMLDRAMETMSELAARPLARPRDFGMAFSGSVHALINGDMTTAEALANEALTIGLRRYSSSWAMATYAALLLSIRDAQDQLGHFVGVLTQAADEMPDVSGIQCALALATACAGDEVLAANAIEATLSSNRQELRLDHDLTWTGSATLLGRAAVLVGDEQCAMLVRSALRPHARRMAVLGMALVGPVDATLAEIELLLGDSLAAASHLQSAHDCVRTLGTDVYSSRLDRIDATIAEDVE